jgi:predicted dehydrogenase
MQQPDYRAGIIGLGFVGAGDQVSGDRLGQQVAALDGTHYEALDRHPQVQLVAGSSREPGRRQRFQQRAGVPTFESWQEMLATQNLDIVSVATYAPTHAEIVAACAQSGVRAILCEKPMATRLPDAERMIAACQQSGSLLVINHNRRFHPHYRELTRRVTAGELGQLTGVWLTWGAGRLANIGTHFIDAALMLTGSTVTSVSATLDPAGRPDCRGPEFRDPGGWAMLRLKSGPVIHIHAPDYSNSPAEVLIHGTLGRASISGGAARIEKWGSVPEILPPVSPISGTSMDQAVSEIVQWLDDATPLGCTADASRHALEVIVACHASHARRGAWTDLPLSGPDREIEVHAG